MTIFFTLVPKLNFTLVPKLQLGNALVGKALACQANLPNPVKPAGSKRDSHVSRDNLPVVNDLCVVLVPETLRS